MVVTIVIVTFLLNAVRPAGELVGELDNVRVVAHGVDAVDHILCRTDRLYTQRMSVARRDCKDANLRQCYCVHTGLLHSPL
jgi:hypothetical protein